MLVSLAIPCADAAPAPSFPTSRPRGPRRFGRTPIDAVSHPELTGNDCRVLAALEFFARFTYPSVQVSQRRVAARAGVSLRGLLNNYRRLQAHGFIQRAHGHVYREAHECVQITLLDPPIAPARPSAPNRQIAHAPNAQIADAPNAQNPAPNRQIADAPNRQTLPIEEPKRTLYMGLNTERVRIESGPPSNLANPDEPDDPDGHASAILAPAPPIVLRVHDCTEQCEPAPKAIGLQADGTWIRAIGGKSTFRPTAQLAGPARPAAAPPLPPELAALGPAAGPEALDAGAIALGHELGEPQSHSLWRKYCAGISAGFIPPAALLATLAESRKPGIRNRASFFRADVRKRCGFAVEKGAQN